MGLYGLYIAYKRLTSGARTSRIQVGPSLVTESLSSGESVFHVEGVQPPWINIQKDVVNLWFNGLV